MKLMKLTGGSFHKFHMKWPLLQDPLFTLFHAGIPTEQRPSEQDLCSLAVHQETCSSIFNNATTGGRRGGLSSAFQHYCKTIPAYVPCLEENKADYMLRLKCESFFPEKSPFKHILTPEKMWNMSITFLNTVNGIVCSRTDELVNLVVCVKMNKKSLLSRLVSTCRQHLTHPSITETLETVDCAAVYGFTSCVKDVLVAMCGTDVEDILETVYYDVVIGVVGEGIGCEEEPNPLLSFVRSVRDQLEQ